MAEKINKIRDLKSNEETIKVIQASGTFRCPALDSVLLVVLSSPRVPVAMAILNALRKSMI